MTNIPSLKYKDIEPLIDKCNNLEMFETLIIDDPSLEVLLRIETILKKLESVGGDELRRLWLIIKAPQKKYRQDDADQHGCYWNVLVSGHYNECHYLYVHTCCISIINISSTKHIGQKREECTQDKADVVKSLLKLENYVSDVVKWICKDPDGYNAFIEDNLPYFKRHGKISRSAYNNIFPENRRIKNPGEVLKVINEAEKIPLTTFPNMTLDIYMHMWRKTYEAFMSAKNDSSFHLDKTDKEIFCEYSNAGHSLNGTDEYDFNSRESFLKWHDDMDGYHYSGLAYIGMNLQACQKDGWYDFGEKSEIGTVSSGNWYFELSAMQDYYPYIIKIIKAFTKEGIRVLTPGTYIIREMIDESDYIGIVPSASKYLSMDGVTEEYSFPVGYKDKKNKQVKALIEAVEWDPIEQVKPIMQ